MHWIITSSLWKNKLDAILLVLGLLLSFNALTQSKEGLRYDIELWTEVGIKKKLNDNLSFQVDYAHRFQDTFQTVKNRFFNLNAEYDINKEIEIGLAYRIFLKDENGFAGRRWMPQVNIEPNTGKLRFRGRSRMDIENNEEGNWIKTWRNQIRIKYNPESFFITPSFTYELFHHLGKIQFGSYKNRAMISFEIDLNKMHELEFSVGAQQEWNVRKPQFDEIFSLSYQFDF